MNDPVRRNDYRINDRVAFDNGTGEFAMPIAVADRSTFIMKTYLHLLGAILLFTGIEAAIFSTDLAARISSVFIGGRAWLLVLGAFVLVSWGATHIANSAGSLGAQYLALGVFVVAEALIFVPLLFIANQFFPGVIQSAALCTLVGFAGLTLVVYGTRKDFSFLRSILMWGGIAAFVAIVAAVVFGFELGVFFSVAMIALAGGAILYDTSNILHHYPEDRYVGAALALFASVAMMFYYVLRLLMQLRR